MSWQYCGRVLSAGSLDDVLRALVPVLRRAGLPLPEDVDSGSQLASCLGTGDAVANAATDLLMAAPLVIFGTVIVLASASSVLSAAAAVKAAKA